MVGLGQHELYLYLERFALAGARDDAVGDAMRAIRMHPCRETHLHQEVPCRPRGGSQKVEQRQLERVDEFLFVPVHTVGDFCDRDISFL